MLESFHSPPFQTGPKFGDSFLASRPPDAPRRSSNFTVIGVASFAEAVSLKIRTPP
ncbi:hypothetical protein D3C83_243170 [compost metagenome]